MNSLILRVTFPLISDWNQIKVESPKTKSNLPLNSTKRKLKQILIRYFIADLCTVSLWAHTKLQLQSVNKIYDLRPGFSIAAQTLNHWQTRTAPTNCNVLIETETETETKTKTKTETETETEPET